MRQRSRRLTSARFRFSSPASPSLSKPTYARAGCIDPIEAGDGRLRTSFRNSDAAPRQQEIIRVDEISPDVAAAKVRVRIGQTCFLDHLILHRIDGKWFVTSKGFHVE